MRKFPFGIVNILEARTTRAWIFQVEHICFRTCLLQASHLQVVPSNFIHIMPVYVSCMKPDICIHYTGLSHASWLPASNHGRTALFLRSAMHASGPYAGHLVYGSWPSEGQHPVHPPERREC
jgi:hypothetical protein